VLLGRVKGRRVVVAGGGIVVGGLWHVFRVVGVVVFLLVVVVGAVVVLDGDGIVVKGRTDVVCRVLGREARLCGARGHRGRVVVSHCGKGEGRRKRRRGVLLVESGAKEKDATVRVQDQARRGRKERRKEVRKEARKEGTDEETSRTREERKGDNERTARKERSGGRKVEKGPFICCWCQLWRVCPVGRGVSC